MTLKESVRYTFTPDEIVAMGDALARMLRLLGEAERNKTAIVAQLGADIKAARQRCDEIAAKISEGYEFREYDCAVEFNTPKDGVKTIRRVDNNEIVREIPMSNEERQQELFEDDGRKRKR